MPDLVKQAFLEWMEKQESDVRLTNYQLYGDYYAGDQEDQVPEKIRKALESELGVTFNYSRLVVDAAVQYLFPKQVGIEVLPDDLSSETMRAEAEKALIEVYTDPDNDMLLLGMLKLGMTMCKYGDAFIKVYIETDAYPEAGETGENEIRIRVIDPSLCFPQYRSDDYQTMVSCTIKWFDFDAEGKMVWKAQVFYPDRVEIWELATEEPQMGTWSRQETHWQFISETPNPFRMIPVIHVKNTVDTIQYGVSDIHPIKDPQDLVNKTVTDLATTMDMESFKDIWILGHKSPKDYIWKRSPGVVHEIPSETAKVQYGEVTDISALISTWDKAVDAISVLSQTPKMLLAHPGGGPISGYALRVAYMPLEQKCEVKRAILKSALLRLNELVFKGIQILGGPDYTQFRTEIHFEKALPVDEKEQTEIHQIESAMGIKSKQTIMEERGIEDPKAELEKIAEEQSGEMERMTRAGLERTNNLNEIENFTAELPNETTEQL